MTTDGCTSHPRQRGVFILGITFVLLLLLVFAPTRWGTRSSVVQAAPDVPTNSIVINEFAAKGTEWVELYNASPITQTLAGWYLTDAGACGTPTSAFTTTLTPGAFFVVNSGDAGANFNLSNTGATLRLCDGADTEVDRVAYGTAGGAPIGPSTGVATYSTARVVDGQDTNNDAADWNLDKTPTPGAPNDVPATALGSSILIDEVDVYPASGNDMLELYNPTTSPITVTGWWISDGDDFAQIVGTVVVPAGGIVALDMSTDVQSEDFGVNFTSTDVAYLFDANRVRVDQLGWSGEFEDGCFARIPDGAGPNDGYDWTSSGGGSTLLDLPCSLGALNGGPVVINEFAAKGTEWVELYNRSPMTLTLTGWYLTDATCGGTTNPITSTTPITPGGLFVVNNNDPGDNFSLNNSGDTLLLCTDANAIADIVSYGNVGSAPLASASLAQYATARVQDGVRTGDDAADWNVDRTPTMGMPNDVAGTALGSSVVLNEIDVFPTSGNDMLELYNPTSMPITVTGWWISDGDDWAVITSSIVITPGGFATLEEGVDWQAENTGVDFDSTDVAYLFDATFTRLDQIGWSGEFEDNCFARVPDGAGPHNGYDWTSSGGGSTWLDQTCTLGSTNVPPAPSGALVVGKATSGLAVIGETHSFTITISTGANDVPNVVLTDTLPVSTTYVADSSGITPTMAAPGVYVWSFGTVPMSSTITFNLTVTIDANVAPGTVLTNTVTVSSDLVGDDPSDNTAQASTTAWPLVSIQQIQQVSDPATNDASPLVGQSVWVEGIVTSEPGDIDTPNRIMVIQDEAGGPWSGLVLFRSAGFDPAMFPVGTKVRVFGTVTEYFGLTELTTNLAMPIGTATPPAPYVLSTGQFAEADPATSEQWEGVFVEFQNATVTNADLGYGEWQFDDGSGPTRADDLGEKDGDLTYLPTLGDLYGYIRGIAWYSFGNYKLEPRSDADIRLVQTTPTIVKSAPLNVAPNSVFTYTITITNELGYDLTGVVVTDRVPTANATLAQVLDGGTLNNGVISWMLGTVSDTASVQVRFVMTATGTFGSVITNDAYGVVATNFPTPTLGTPVLTTIGDYTPIYTIQGNDFLSPFRGSPVKTRGVVVGFFEGNYPGSGSFNGFFIQDESGDGDPATSDGIFVHVGTDAVSPTVQIGDVVTVTGTVEEFIEWDDNACPDTECITQIRTSMANVQVAGTGSVTPTIITPVGDPTQADAYWESLEGMLVTAPNTQTVTGPTSFGAIYVIPGSEGVERALRNTPQEGMPVGVRHYERYGNIGGADAPGLIVGSVVTDVAGPLGFSYGDYMVVTQPGKPWQVVSAKPLPDTPPAWSPPTTDTFSAATFNTLNFDAADPAVKMTKVVSTVLQLGGPTFLALQEIDSTSVITDLITNLAAAGVPYAYAASHPDIGGHGVALLWRTDQVTNTVWSTQYQACSPNGSPSAPTYDSYCDAIPDEYPLFSRRPVVLTGTVMLDSGPMDVVVIANHFKSKRGGAEADARRLEQGQFIGNLAAQLYANGSRNILIMGDLNDFEDSPPLQAIYASGVITSTWYQLPPNERYSFIFEGVSQVLDHVLISNDLLLALKGAGALRIDADYPYSPYADLSVVWRASDHDPVVATFGAIHRFYFPLLFKNAP